MRVWFSDLCNMREWAEWEEGVTCLQPTRLEGEGAGPLQEGAVHMGLEVFCSSSETGGFNEQGTESTRGSSVHLECFSGFCCHELQATRYPLCYSQGPTPSKSMP